VTAPPTHSSTLEAQSLQEEKNPGTQEHDLAVLLQHPFHLQPFHPHLEHPKQSPPTQDFEAQLLQASFGPGTQTLVLDIQSFHPVQVPAPSITSLKPLLLHDPNVPTPLS
jgi:hypothetical protein